MIFVSAGHHPLHPGFSWHGFSEHDEAVRWRDELVHQLEIAGADVLRVPVGVIQEKMLFINNRHPSRSFAVEIHFDGALDKHGNSIGDGSRTLFHPDQTVSQSLATTVQDSYGDTLPPDRGTRVGWFKNDPQFGPEMFLLKTRCPAIIVVPAYIHERKLIEGKRQTACRLMAVALAEAHENLVATEEV